MISASMLFIYMCVCVFCLYLSVLYIFHTYNCSIKQWKKIVDVCEIVMLFFGLSFVCMFSHALLILASDNLLFGRLRH
jgi:hypothetical protein